MTLADVFKFHEDIEGRSLKRWEINKILDKYNFDKERLFKEVSDMKEELATNGKIKAAQPAQEEVTQEVIDQIMEKMEGEAIDGQVEVVFVIDNILPEQMDDIQEELFRFLEVMNLLDVDTIVSRSTIKHALQDDEMHYLMRVHSYTDEREEIDFDTFYKQCVQYCEEFEVQAALSQNKETGTINIEITKF